MTHSETVGLLKVEGYYKIDVKHAGWFIIKVKRKNTRSMYDHGCISQYASWYKPSTEAFPLKDITSVTEATPKEILWWEHCKKNGYCPLEKMEFEEYSIY